MSELQLTLHLDSFSMADRAAGLLLPGWLCDEKNFKGLFGTRMTNCNT